MFPQVFKILVLILFSIVSACGTSRNIQEIDDSSRTDASGTLSLGKGPIHSKDGWLHAIQYQVAYNVPESVIDGIVAAAKTWNDALGQNLLVYSGRLEKSRSEVPTDLYASLEDDSTIFYYDSNWASDTGKSKFTLATTVWENSPVNAEAIVKGDVRFNAQNFNFVDSLKDSPSGFETLDVVDTESVMLHEIGHLIGLDHVTTDEDPDSIMHAQTPIGYGFAFRTLSAMDIERVLSIYRK